MGCLQLGFGGIALSDHESTCTCQILGTRLPALSVLGQAQGGRDWQKDRGRLVEPKMLRERSEDYWAMKVLESNSAKD